MVPWYRTGTRMVSPGMISSRWVSLGVLGHHVLKPARRYKPWTGVTLTARSTRVGRQMSSHEEHVSCQQILLRTCVHY